MISNVLETKYQTSNQERLDNISTDIISDYTMEVLASLCLMTNNILLQTALLTIFYDIRYLTIMFNQSSEKRKRVVTANFDLLASQLDLAELEHGVESEELLSFIQSFKLEKISLLD